VRVPARVRIGAALVVALGALAGVFLLVARIRSNESDVGRLGFASTSAAPAPFAAFGQARVAVGSRCLRVLVASTETQRVQGLRGVRSLAPFEGMVFVFPRDTNARFTMADTPTPLDITFFSAGGAPVDGARMKPCPAGTDASCPAYASRERYRYALERPAGSASASGAIGACAA
jgi:uncharacterized membrane protein (UPF0127 family)